MIRPANGIDMLCGHGPIRIRCAVLCFRSSANAGQIALNVVVVPAADNKRRNVDLVQTTACAVARPSSHRTRDDSASPDKTRSAGRSHTGPRCAGGDADTSFRKADAVTLAGASFPRSIATCGRVSSRPPASSSDPGTHPIRKRPERSPADAGFPSTPRATARCRDTILPTCPPFPSDQLCRAIQSIVS